MVSISRTWFFNGAVGCSLLTATFTAQSMTGVPPFGDTTWSVQTCELDDLCEVIVRVDKQGSKCTIYVDDIIDFAPKYTNRIQWQIVSDAPGIEFNFGDTTGTKNGISIAEAEFTDQSGDKFQITKKFTLAAAHKAKFFLYDINIMWKPTTGGVFTDCKTKGPVIVSRG